MLDPTRTTLLLAACAGTGFLYAPAADTAGAAPPDITCAIDVRRTGDGVVLEPLVSSRRTISGSYRLSVTTHGPGGSSDIDQSGAFTATGAETLLGSVSLAGGGGFDARLTVTVGGRRYECRKRAGGAIPL